MNVSFTFQSIFCLFTGFASIFCSLFLLSLFVFAGLDEQGLFRVSGSAKVVEKIKTMFDRGGDIDLEQFMGDLSAVAGALKQFLVGCVANINKERAFAGVFFSDSDHHGDKSTLPNVFIRPAVCLLAYFL